MRILNALRAKIVDELESHSRGRSRRDRRIVLEALERRVALSNGASPHPAFVVHGATSSAVHRAFTSISLDITETSSTRGQQVTITADVARILPPVHYLDGGHTLSPTGPPTGIVTFTVDGKAIGHARLHSVGGKAVASLTAPTPGVGRHVITASYSGNSQYQAASTRATQVLHPAFSSVNLQIDSTHGAMSQQMTISADVALILPPVHYLDGGETRTPTGPPTGIVTFTVDGKAIGHATLRTVGGKAVASLNAPSPGAGRHVITASYSGDSQYQASSARVTQTIMTS